MTDTAIIAGDFCTFRHVQGRKVLQIVIEVPAEAAGSVFAKLGMPGSGEGIPVAVARLQTSPEPIAKPEAQKERRPFSELPYSQQCALRCNEALFQSFCASYDPVLYQNHQKQGDEAPALAADIIRRRCEVSSRSSIIKGTPAGDKWEALEAEYYAWQRGGIR